MSRKKYILQPLPTWADDRLRHLYKHAKLVLAAYEAAELATFPIVSPFVAYHEQLYRDGEGVRLLENSYRLPDATKSSIGTGRGMTPDDF